MKKLPLPRLLVISLLSFGLTFLSNVQDPPLMTYKVHQLAPNLPNTALGFLGFLGLLVAMLVQPVVGVFSDRAHTRLGRRLPFIIGGVVLLAAALFLMAAAPNLWLLVTGIVFVQFAANFMQGPWQALIPDLVPASQHGAAASLKASLDIIALVGGGAAAGMILGEQGIAQWGQNAVFVISTVTVTILIVIVSVTAAWAREQPGNPSPAAKRPIGAALRHAYSVDFRRYPLFAWWFANRVLFWGAFIALNAFLINYLVDVIQMGQAEAQSFYGSMKIILGTALVLLALLAGWFSDRYGRKPVMLASGLVAFAGIFTLFFVRDKNLIILGAAIIGMGIGAFLSASWALATDIVPREEAARYLGIANIATCLGSGGARLLGALLIDPINTWFSSSSAGYLALYGLAGICFLLSTLAILPLPNTRK
ncbi:MAG: MFS transporter [Chloroflexota bacterium]